MDLDNKERILLIVGIIVLVVVLGFNYLYRSSQIRSMDIVEEELEEIEDSKEVGEHITYIEEVDNSIMIHISGAVLNPGIIETEMGKRLVDIVELAGGLEKDADLDRINLARKVSDEEKIYIPMIGEEVELEAYKIVEKHSSSGDEIININNCSKEDLIKLPGIGEKTADKIIEYRSTNSFQRIEDIMGVSGIGEKKFEAIKDSISTN